MRITVITRARRMLIVLMLLIASLGVTFMSAVSASAAVGTIVLSPAIGAAGTSVTASGSGFGRRTSGSLTFDGQSVGSFQTSTKGRFSLQFAVPAGEPRSVVVRATTAATSATAAFVVTSTAFEVPPPPSTTSPAVLTELFTGADGVFVSESAFWGSSDAGLSQNGVWFAESGSLNRQSGVGRVTDSSWAFRMWTRQTDLAYTTTEMDVRFDGWYGGGEGWHGVNLWLNRTLCTPLPGCSKVNDVGGNAGYVVDFNNRDGSLMIMKKTADPAPDGTYHVLASTKWSPVVGQTYRWGGRVVDNGNGSSTIQLLINGTVRLQATDNGSVGGGRLTGGRVGVRGDYANVAIDNITISRPTSVTDVVPDTSSAVWQSVSCPAAMPVLAPTVLCSVPTSVTR